MAQNPPAPAPDPAETPAQLADDIGAHFASLGLSSTAGRVLGALALEPAGELTAPVLVERLGVAKSSMSVALGVLTRYGLVERRRGAAARADRFRLADDAFEAVFASKLGELARFPELAERGIALSGDPAVRARLERMRDYYRFLLREFPVLLERWADSRLSD